MRGNSLSSKLASQQIKQGPAKEAWWREEVRFEIERLKAILRDPEAITRGVLNCSRRRLIPGEFQRKFSLGSERVNGD